MPTSTVPPIAAQRQQGHQPAPVGAPGGGVGGATAIDPVRLLRMYWPWLAAAGVLSVLVGAAAYVALGRLAPAYRSDVVYEVLPPHDPENIGSSVGFGGRQEIEVYMETQVSVIESDRILDRAVKQPAILNTSWAKQFTVNGVFVTGDALKEMRKIVGASVIPDTRLVRFGVTTASPQDAQIIASTIDEVFRQDNVTVSTRDAQSLIEDLERKVRALRQDIAALDVRIDNIINEQQLGSADERTSVFYAQIQNLQPALVDIQSDISAATKQLERFQEMRGNPSGPIFPETIREEVERGPIAQNLLASIQTEEAYLKADQEVYGPEHRSVKNRQKRVRALKEQRERVISQQMQDRFAAAIEGLEQNTAAYQSQYSDLMTQLQEARQSLNEITRVLAEKENLETDRRQKIEQIENFQKIIDNSRLVADRGSRVRVLSGAQIPDTRAFPKPIPVMGASIVLITGAVGGLIFLREMREQRVRTPLDVSQISRTRVLGIIPEIGLDPSNPVQVETACIDRPQGAVAETVRQIRTSMVKNMRQHGHKSAVFVSGLPGSGTTTVVSNLAANIATIDLRVLVIDANLRRPAVHRIFETEQGPGLGDVLNAKASFDEAVQETGVRNVSVLTAGIETEHAYERFNTQAMADILHEAGNRFDLILIDAPPAVVSGDAMALTAQADAVALVVRAYSEKKGLVARVRNQLGESRAEFLGVVVNAVRSSAGGYFKRNFQATMAYTNGSANGSMSRDVEAAKRGEDDTPAES